MLDCLPDPVILTDTDLTIVGMNAAARQRYGDDLVDNSLLAMIRQPNALSCISRSMEEDRMNMETITEYLHDIECKMRMVANPLHIAEPEFHGLMLALADITTVSDAEDARKEFVANVSHELKSPLTALIGFIDTLSGNPEIDRETRDGFLQVMRDEATRMSRLVSELLSLSRVEADERIQPTDHVDINDIIRLTVTSLLPLSEEVGTEITVITGSDPIFIPGDHDQLKQVFSNLLENAVKYSTSGSKVTIRSEVSPGHGDQGSNSRATVEIVDEGPGISAEHLPRLTERFYRVDDHRSRGPGGAGLGLAIVKHILNRHRSTLAIRSVPGEGSTFTVNFLIHHVDPPESGQRHENLTQVT